jgi:DNA-binding transcriptional ArsR family regulator
MRERDTQGSETLSPAKAFAAVSNETRVDILQALAEHHGTTTFSELRAAVGMRDAAQFNYHLKQLQPQFVTKVEATDETPGGYRLRYAGKEVVRAILVGTFTTDVVREAFAIDGECVSCGEATGPVRRGDADHRVWHLRTPPQQDGVPGERPRGPERRGTARGVRPLGSRGVQPRGPSATATRPSSTPTRGASSSASRSTRRCCG